MIYDLRLRLFHSYGSAADGARHLLRIAPLSLPNRQQVMDLAIQADPAPDSSADLRDFFGNALTRMTHRAEHTAMQIEMTARVTLTPASPPTAPGLTLSDLAPTLAALTSLAPQAPAHFLGPSPRVPLPEDVTAYARAETAAATTVAEALHSLGAALHRDMRFDPQATTVDTSLTEAFTHRHGVCQDFAHIMIAGLRSLGIPARYVSGFLRTEPPEGQPRLEGADAMHAWISAWCGPDLGWVEFDPTNNTAIETDHIVVAYGRDYGDVAPIKGVLRASGLSSVGQGVDVIPVAP